MASKPLSRLEVDADRFAVPDVQIAVGFRRKPESQLPSGDTLVLRPCLGVVSFVWQKPRLETAQLVPYKFVLACRIVRESLAYFIVDVAAVERRKGSSHPFGEVADVGGIPLLRSYSVEC